MRGLVWGLFGFLALLWSLFAWLLYELAGAGGVVVTKVSRWLEIDLDKTQWLADGLVLAGGMAQVLVVLMWLMGMGLILMFAWMGSQAAGSVRDLGEELQRDPAVRGGGTVLEGEVIEEREQPQRPSGRIEP